MVSLIILGFFIVFYTLKAFLIAPLVAAQRKRYVQEKQKEEACRLKKELEDIKKMNFTLIILGAFNLHYPKLDQSGCQILK